MTEKKRSKSVIQSKHNLFRIKPRENKLLDRYITEHRYISIERKPVANVIQPIHSNRKIPIKGKKKVSNNPTTYVP